MLGAYLAGHPLVVPSIGQQRLKLENIRSLPVRAFGPIPTHLDNGSREVLSA